MVNMDENGEQVFLDFVISIYCGLGLWVSGGVFSGPVDGERG